MSLLYAISVENRDTGERDPWLWNQSATSHAEALRLSDQHLRDLGWPRGWRSTGARIIGEGLQYSRDAVVETILPGTPEWEVSEQALEHQRRHGG